MKSYRYPKKLRPDVDFITWRRNLSCVSHDTENPTSPCNFKDNGRDYTDNQTRIVRMPF